MDPSICLIAGENSGDLLGAEIVRALRSVAATPLHCWGVTGPAMRQAGVETVEGIESQGVMGLQAVVLRLPQILGLLRRLTRVIRERNPAAVILIDYPGFNLRLAAQLRKSGYSGRIIQLVCPSIWAHGKGRLRKMEQTHDLVLCILPFEPALFEHSSLRATYIGNPVAERTLQAAGRPATCLSELAYRHPLVGIFPGSREHEIQRHLPKMLEAARWILREHPDVRFVLSCAHHSIHRTLRALACQDDFLRIGDTLYLVDQSHNPSLMRLLRAAVAKSGTVTLELALHSVPTVMVYYLSWIEAIVARYVLGLNLPHYCLVNLLSKQEVFPELIYQDFEPERVAEALSPFLTETPQRRQCIEHCLALQESLSQPKHPSETAARLILDLL